MPKEIVGGIAANYLFNNTTLGCENQGKKPDFLCEQRNSLKLIFSRRQMY